MKPTEISCTLMEIITCQLNVVYKIFEIKRICLIKDSKAAFGKPSLC